MAAARTRCARCSTSPPCAPASAPPSASTRAAMREPEATGPHPPAGGEGAPQPRPAAATPPPLTFPTAPGRIAVGRINGVWGMKGHVKVTSLTSNAERLKADATVIVRGRPTRIEEVVTPQGYPIIRFEGYYDRTAAERLRDTYIEIEEHELAPLPEDEYYVDDLVGMDVVTT